MLLNASVARSFTVVGWTCQLIQVCGGTVLIADGVYGADPEDPSELRRIRTALLRQADQARLGSRVASRALEAARGLDRLLALGPDQLTVLTLDDDELKLSVRLQSRRPEDRVWRESLGAKGRRLDAWESASIAIAATRSLAFAGDDEDALTVWEALAGAPGRRTRDLLRQLVTDGIVDDHEARAVHHLLRSDDLHNLGGPAL